MITAPPPNAARLRETETRWQDVRDDDIARSDSCLIHFDPAGFHYYLAAYLVWYLRNIDNQDPESPAFISNTFDALIFVLQLADWGDWQDYYFSRFTVFTSEQSKVIAHFLEFESQREDCYLDETERQKMLMEKGLSQEEIEIPVRKIESSYQESDLSENGARRALEMYWGQFL